MDSMNQIEAALRLREFMASNEGWGRDAGREVYRKLVDFVESKSGIAIFRVSMAGVKRIDISFASETIVELARKHRGKKGFCFVDLGDADMEENWEAAAERAKQPLMKWEGTKSHILGVKPSVGIADALDFALTRVETKASEFAGAHKSVSITNASTKFKQLWEQGFLLRRESVAESGGVEYVYVAIK
jgi:hypothetical protein